MYKIAKELQQSRDKLQDAVAKLLETFEADTGLTIDGVYLHRLPTTIGEKHGDIHAVSIEVLL